MVSGMNQFLRGLSHIHLSEGAYDWVDLNGEPENDGTVRVLVVAPDDTPYAGGLFSVNLKVTEFYPQKPPEVSFNTRIWHPLVDWDTGRICQDFFREDWHSTDGPAGVFARLRSFFYVGKVFSAINFEAAEQLSRNDGSFAEQARNETERYASN